MNYKAGWNLISELPLLTVYWACIVSVECEHYFNKYLRSCLICSHICINCFLFGLLPFPTPSAAHFAHGHSIQGYLSDSSLGSCHLLPNLGPSNPENFNSLCGHCASLCSQTSVLPFFSPHSYLFILLAFIHTRLIFNHSKISGHHSLKPSCHWGFMLYNPSRQNTFYGIFKLTDFTNAPLLL